MLIPDLEVKQTLVGLHRYQLTELKRICELVRRPRSEIIREAVDLWIRGFKIQRGIDNGTTTDK